ARVLRGEPEGKALLPKIREDAITAMTLTDLRTVWRRELDGAMNVTLSPGCPIYAMAEGRTGAVVVRRLADDRELLRVPRPTAPGPFVHLALSWDGSKLLAGYQRFDETELVQVWDIGRTAIAFQKDGRFGSWRFHRDGRRLLHWSWSE